MLLSRETCLSVPCVVLWPVHGSAGVYQSLCFGLRVGASEGSASTPLPGRLAGHCEVEGSSATASGTASSVVQGSGDHCTVILGEVRPPAVYSSLVSRDADRHVSRERLPVTSSSCSVLEGGDVFQLPLPPAQMWQQLLGYMVLLECFLPRDLAHMRPLQLQLKDDWSPLLDDPADQIHLL